jgi:diguanylate cyclase (GGDEF)-like protein
LLPIWQPEGQMNSRVLRWVAVVGGVGLLNQGLASTLPPAAGLIIPSAAISAAGVYAAVGFGHQARSAAGRIRTGWLIAAVAAVAMSLSYLVFGVYRLFGVAPADSPGQLFSIVAAVLSAGSVVALAPRLRGWQAWLTSLLDVIGVASGQFALSWQFLLAPATASLDSSARLTFALILLPEVIGSALALVLIAQTSLGHRGYALHLMAGSLGLFALAGVQTTSSAAAGLPWYETGAAMTTALAAALLVMASQSSLAPADERGRRSLRSFWAVMNCMPVFAAITAAAAQYASDGMLSPVLVWALMCAAVFTTLRQLAGYLTVARLATKLDHLAHHDPLTGLGNRVAFVSGATRMLAEAAPGRQVAILLLDLDGFKAVNDTYGHSTGDHLLVTVGQRLAAVRRAGDLAARLGGDEFVVVIAGLTGLEQAEVVAERLIGEVAVPMMVDGYLIDVRTSVGIAVTDVPDDLDAVLKRADQGLYAAKAAGRGRSFSVLSRS